MKKTDFILIGLVIIVVVIAVISTKGTVAMEDIEYPVVLSGEPGLNQISYNDYVTMVENNESFVVIIERTGCYYCQQYMPIVEEYVSEKQIAINYIDTDTLSDEEMNLLSTTNNYLKKNQWGTPTTLFMVGERVIDSISGYVEKDSLDAFFDGRVTMGE